MGNPHKGEVEFKVRDKAYTLHFSINAMCELEEALGIGIMQLAAAMSDPSKLRISDVRTVFWAGLRDHHEAVTETDAGRLMTEMGLGEAMALVAKAFTLAFPEADPKAPLLQASRPASTGKQH